MGFKRWPEDLMFNGMQAVEIELDAKVVADWVVGNASINTAHSMLILD